MLPSLMNYRAGTNSLKDFFLAVARCSKLLLPLLMLLMVFVSIARGESTEGDPLRLLAEEPEQLVTTPRLPRPTSRIAENVTVLTSDDIIRINAHTLADVLNTVPGIQVETVRTPGSNTFFSIQGILNTHILVLMDGVPLNNHFENDPEIGLFPVQQIERIEIVKGAASAAWGEALGGVVNVITKSPDPDRPFAGMASASFGERFTTDLRGEASGTIKRFGYYLSGGNLHSDGLLPGNRVNFNNAYGKFVYDLPDRGTISVGTSFRDAFRGIEESSLLDYRDTNAITLGHSFLNFTYPLNERLSLEFNARESRNDSTTTLGAITVPDNFGGIMDESLRGANAKLVWDDDVYSLVGGIEYDHVDTRLTNFSNSVPTDQLSMAVDRWGAYANGSVSIGSLTILPGIRFDHTGFAGDYLSYTLGATYSLTDKTVLRAYGARGYGLPLISLAHGPQKVWTVQAGVETSEVPYLWLKGTLFYNDIWNLDKRTRTDDRFPEVIKQGFELEAKTVPLYGVSLAGGFTFTDSRDRETNNRLEETPSEQAKLALNYDNSALGLRGALTGNYVWWNSPANREGKYSGIIWDLHLTRKLCPKSDLSPELFFSAHNLFNGSQYIHSLYKNSPRWFEGGVRFRF